MGILEIIIRRRIMTTVLVLIVVILGALSYTELGVRSMPDFDFPIVTVSTVLPSGTPEDVESEVTKRIEDAVNSISGVDEITSYSQQSVSLVIVQFKLEEDVNVKAQDVRDKIATIKADLPREAEDPVIQKIDIGAFPVATLALVGPQDINALYRVADETLQDLLSQVPGVADVALTGGQRREVQVLLDLEKLRQNNVAIDDVVRAISAHNVDIPAGPITETQLEYNVRVKGRIEGAEEIEDIPVRVTADGSLLVRHLGRVVDTFEDRRSISRTNGENSILLSVMKQTDANEVDVSDGVKGMLPQLKAYVPPGAELLLISDQAAFVRGSLSNVRNNIIIGIILTSIVLYLFLGSLRGTMVAAVVIPAAIIASFLMMRLSGFTLNILTLTALALSVGIVINNSILILENASRFIDEGLSPLAAAVRGTKDIALAIFSSTATNLVVFLPIAFMGEIIGRIFKEFGLTIVYATVVSLCVSYTLTPMMCAALLSAKKRPGFVVDVLSAPFAWMPKVWGWAFDRVRALYLDVLGLCLHAWYTRLGTVLGMILLLIGCAVLAKKYIGGEFFPRSDAGEFRITVEAPVGSSLEFTDSRCKQVESILQEEIISGNPEARNYFARVGKVSGFLGGSTGGTNVAEINVTVEDRMLREESVDDMLNRIRPLLAKVPSAKIITSAGSMGGPGGQPIALEIVGTDLDQMKQVVEQVRAIVEQTEGTTGVDQSWRSGQPEISINPKTEGGAREQMPTDVAGSAVRGYIAGHEASTYWDQGENYKIRVRLNKEGRTWAEDVGAYFVKSPVTGEMVTLRQVANLLFESGPTVITRKGRRRLITVSADLTGQRVLKQVQADIKGRMDKEVTPPQGVEVKFGGESEMMAKNMAELYKAMAIASLLTFLAVAGIIESLVLGLILIAALPICLAGVVVAMVIAKVSISMLSMMAMVMLVGMVVNNAIIVLDYAARDGSKGLRPVDRVKDACTVRFRVIVMANLTTVVAMIPLSLGLGFGGEMFRPIAVVQMGGILAAASLSLVVIPCIYALVEPVRAWTMRLARRLLAGE